MRSPSSIWEVGYAGLAFQKKKLFLRNTCSEEKFYFWKSTCLEELHDKLPALVRLSN